MRRGGVRAFPSPCPAAPVPTPPARPRSAPCRWARLAALAGLVASGAAAQPAPPAWAQDAVWYQVFPERFANGDRANDPTWASLAERGRAPEAEWTVSDWTGDWYERQPWERALGPGFYDGVFHRRYGGDLQGVLDRVDYLDSLGVTAVYLNPVFYAPSLHKYDAASYHHVDPHFGPDPEGDLEIIASETADPATWQWTSADRLLLDLVDALHQRGIRLVLDGVFNHTGTDFWAFRDIAEKQQASPYAGWYEVTAWDDAATPDTSEFDWNGWWGYKPLALLADTEAGDDLHPGVKAHVFDVTRRWMDPDGDGDPSDGVDGWRLDVAAEVPDGFWRDWTALVREINPEAYTVAEVWDDASATLARTGFHATMAYHALAVPLDAFAFDRRTDAATFAREVTERFNAYPEATRRALMTVLASHDTDRLASMIVNGGLGAYDRQAGVRDTSAYAVRAPTAEERELQRAAVLLQMALPGAPHVFYGAEAGMWGGDDPDSRKPMLWPDSTYADEALDPLGRARTPDPVAFDDGLFEFYRSAIALRQSDAVLRRGRLATLAADADAVAFERRLGDERRVVAFNRGDADRFLPLPDGAPPVPLVPVFVSSGDVRAVPSFVAGVGETDVVYGLRIPARSTVVYRAARPADVRPRGLDE
jgi:glycosidase